MRITSPKCFYCVATFSLWLLVFFVSFAVSPMPYTFFFSSFFLSTFSGVYHLPFIIRFRFLPIFLEFEGSLYKERWYCYRSLILLFFLLILMAFQTNNFFFLEEEYKWCQRDSPGFTLLIK